MNTGRSVHRKSRIFKGVIIAAVCIGVILLLSAFVFTRNIRDNKEAGHEAVLQNLQKQTGQLLNAINQTQGIMFSLETDSLWTVQHFADADRETVLEDMIDTRMIPNTARGNPFPFADGSPMYRVLNRIRSLNQGNPAFNTLLLYAPKSDCYVGCMQQGTFNLAVFGEEEIRKHIPMAEDQWEKLIENSAVTFAKVNVARGVYDSLVFSQKLNNGLVAVLVLAYDSYEQALLQDTYVNLYHPQGFALLQEEGLGLYWTSREKWFVNPDDFFGLGTMEWDKAPSVIEMDIDKKQYTIMQVQVPAYDLRYVAVFENGPSYVITSPFFTLFLVLTCLWVIGVTLCIIFLFREWYHPVKMIARQLPASLSSLAIKDEYAAVSYAIGKLLTEAGNSDSIIKEQEQMLLSASLLQLLCGDNDIAKYDEKTRIKLNDLCQCYMVFVLCPKENVHWSDRAGNEQEQAYYDSIVPLTLQDRLKEKLPMYTVITMRHQNQLLLFVSDPQLKKETAENCLYEGIETLRLNLSVDISIYQSGVLFGPASAHNAYQRAISMPPQVFGARQEKEKTAPTSEIDQLQMELRMANMIYVEDYARAFTVFHKIIDLIFEQNSVPALLATQISGLIGRTYSILIESNPNNRSILDQTFLLARSINLRDQEQLLALWRSAFLFLRKPDAKTEDFSRQFKSIYQYLLDHFHEDSMSLSVLATQFDLSIPTVSREFQKNTGMGFLDCLHRLRIDKAKKEMTNMGSSIKDIAIAAGYTNVLTMTRAFKKYEGTTPGAYRKDSPK